MRYTEAFKTYPVKTIKEILFKACHRYQDRAALKSKRDGVFQPISYNELKDRVSELATCYFELGLVKGDRVALLGENRTEWVIAYMAAVTSGMVAVPVDRDLEPLAIRLVLDQDLPDHRTQELLLQLRIGLWVIPYGREIRGQGVNLSAVLVRQTLVLHVGLLERVAAFVSSIKRCASNEVFQLAFVKRIPLARLDEIHFDHQVRFAIDLDFQAFTEIAGLVARHGLFPTSLQLLG